MHIVFALLKSGVLDCAPTSGYTVAARQACLAMPPDVTLAIVSDLQQPRFESLPKYGGYVAPYYIQ